MLCHRFRKPVLLLALAILLLPLVLWVLVVLIAPTGWARSYVVSVLEQNTGRSVQLDRLEVCLSGGVSLVNLRIGAPRAMSDPWLKAKSIKIDVSPFQLLRGRFEPTRLEVDGANLRVLRRADGSLELADLAEKEAAEVASQADRAPEPHQCGACKLKARLLRSKIALIDEPSKTIMNFDQVEGEADLEADGALMLTLSGRWNDGPFQLVAHLEDSAGHPGFDGQLRAQNVNMDQGMAAIRYAVPVLAGAPVELNGRLSADVYLNGRGSNRAEVTRSLTGRGSLMLDPIVLNGTPLIAEFARISGQATEEVIGAVKTNFAIRNGRITTENLTMNLGKVPVVVTGWTDFNGMLEYQIKLDNLADRIPEQARQYLSSLDLDVNALTSLRLSGNVDRVTIRPTAGSNGRQAAERLISPDDRQRLKVLGRQIRDKLLR